MRLIKYIVIHCSAGFGDVEANKKYWKEALGWDTVGYHYFVDTDGTEHKLADIANPTNGVKGFNANAIHICYQGGVAKKGGKFIAVDTRTLAQKETIVTLIANIKNELSALPTQKNIRVTVLGHRDFSPDKNGNGVIESWERIKECPSFDAIAEYRML